MSDEKQQAVPFFTRYLEVELCEDLSEQEMNQVQGGLTIAKRPYHDSHEPFPIIDHFPIKPIRPRPIRPVHPIDPPVGHPNPQPLPHPGPIFTSKSTDLYEPILPVDNTH